MMRRTHAQKATFLLFALVLTIPLLTAVLSQYASAQADKGRAEGRVVRTNPEKSSLPVREEKSGANRSVMYDSSTKWVS